MLLLNYLNSERKKVFFFPMLPIPEEYCFIERFPNFPLFSFW